TYTKVFSSTLIEMAEADGKVVAITAAMPEGTGLGEFKERFPERFIDVGIAEQHAITFASGLAREGFKPVTAIYSTFLQRAYDQVFHDVCLDNVPLIMALDRAGLVGADGPTHHGLYDIAYLRHLPNMIVAAPKDGAELRSMMHSAVRYNAPVAIRYPRGATPEGTITDVRSAAIEDIELGRSEQLREGKDLTIIALGTMVGAALEAAESLNAKGIDAAVINARFVKPLDSEAILKAAKATGRIITIEEAALQGGFGSAVLELLEAEDVDCLVRRIGVPDSFIEQGTQKELYKDLGLDAEGIEKTIVEFMKRG
ncbi:MAG: 1-deoxy-D-xylulose-5-phosphate synthase, partial [Deltaproteobacteria bacterium]|nr:1-deoxy-D-xylulose-5-phosphate synthase [Deltaproteobacteria bacterium]